MGELNGFFALSSCPLEEGSADGKPPQGSRSVASGSTSPSSPFCSLSEQGARPAWHGQRSPSPVLLLGACPPGRCLICCHHFVSLVLSGSRKLGGHSGPHPSGSGRARGGCLPKGVSGELHTHRLWHRYLPLPVFTWLPCSLLGCFLFAPGYLGALGASSLLGPAGVQSPGCREAGCGSCSSVSVHQGELMPCAWCLWAALISVLCKDGLCELITISKIIYWALTIAQGDPLPEP